MKDYSVLDNMIRMVGDTIKQAFDKGYEQGYTDRKDEAYQKGLNDAWDVARKLTHPSYGGYYDDTKLEIFGYRNSDDVLTMLSASEAISRIKEYDEKQADDEIRIGDEVVIIDDNDNDRYIVTSTDDGVTLFDNKGHVYPFITKQKEVKRTGRHFSQIEEILEQMRENDND